MSYLRRLFNRPTPQTEPLAGQVPNNAGGFVWSLDAWSQLDRFLILGAEGNTYYATEQRMARENAQTVEWCVREDGLRLVARVLEVSEAGLAPKNDPALFALALAISYGDPATRSAGYAALPRIARTSTHLFHFLAFVDQMRGWGRGLRTAVAQWYNQQAPAQLAYQAIKYRQRDGWTHRDALRLSHPQAPDPEHNAIYHWITKGWPGVGIEPHPDPLLRQIWAFETLQQVTDAAQAADLIQTYRLPREAVPTELLKQPLVWEALLHDMPIEALTRNLATMTRVGLLQPGSAATHVVSQRLQDGERIRRARLHPIKLLAALLTYQQGRGVRGNASWQPVPQLIDALNAAFYLAFQAVEPTGKRLVLALDVSGSMDGGMVAGVPGLTPRLAASALAMVTAATEQTYTVVGFTASQDGSLGGQWGGGDASLTPLDVSPQRRIDDVAELMRRLPMGGTDCSLPMRWALQHQVQADAFLIYTDNETWAGPIHPAEALQNYRQATGIPAKLVVIGMLANKFSIADPNDPGMFDVVGFSTDTPAVIANMVR